MKLRAGDFLIIGLILIVSASIWAYPALSKTGVQAIVRQNGVVVATPKLHHSQTISLHNATVSVSHGKISILSAKCPDQVCVKTGAISKPGETIVCVPNHIVITIDGKSDLDVVAN